VAAEWLDCLVSARHQARRMTLSAAVTATSLSPWMFVVARRARITGGGVLDSAAGIARPQVVDVIEPYWKAIGTSPWLGVDLFIVCAAAAIIALHMVRGRERRPVLTTLLLAATLPTAVAMGMSVAGSQSIWIARYLIGTTVPFLMLIAVSASALLPTRAAKYGVLLALWPAAVAVTALVDGREKVRYDRLAIQLVAASSGGIPDVYVMDYYEGGPLQWMAKHTPSAMHVRGIDSLAAIRSTQGWIVWSENHPPRGAPPPAGLIRRGYTLGTPIVETGMFDELLGRRDSVIALPFTRSAR
jgi:hypothetical protein